MHTEWTINVLLPVNANDASQPDEYAEIMSSCRVVYIKTYSVLHGYVLCLFKVLNTES